MSLYIGAYDIASNTRRRQVVDVLRRYGVRIQQSVFEFRLDPDDVVELRRRLGPILAREDAFDIVPVDERPGRRRYRWLRDPEVWEPVLLR